MLRIVSSHCQLIESSRGGKGLLLAEERINHESKQKTSSHHQAAVSGGGRLLLSVNALQTFGYRCQHYSLSLMEACGPPRVSEQLMHWVK